MVLLTQYRDDRLKLVQGSTVLHELSIVSDALEVGKKGWNLLVPRNPVRLIRKPKAPRPRNRRLEVGEL